MTHEQAHALLLDLAYGELARDKALEVQRHADECAACAAELDGIATARGFAARTADTEEPPSGRAELVAAARRGVAPRSSRWALRPRVTAFVAVAAVVAIVAGVTVQVLNDRSRRGDVDGPAPDVEVTPLPRPLPPAVAPVPPRSPAPAAAPERARAPAPAQTPAPAAAPAPRVAPRRAETDDSEPARRKTSEAPRAAAPAPVSAHGARAPAQDVVAEVDRRAAAGDLSTEERRLTCRGGPVERIALVTRDGRIVKLTVRRAGRVVAQAWYDEDGTRRAMRREDPAPPDPEPPARAPGLAEVGSTCEW